MSYKKQHNAKTKLARVIKGAALFLAVSAGLASSLPVLISAQSPVFTQGYETDQQLRKGMIVRLKEGDDAKVEPLPADTMDDMFGVVVDPNDAPVTLSSEGNKVFIATTGRFAVLVSDQNGPIKTGDYITISALQGVGMKAGNSQTVVVGRALGGFDGENRLIGSTVIKDSAGGEQEARLGLVEADITVSRNPLYRQEEPNLPEFLRKASETIAGKPVEATRVYIGMVVFGITTAISFSLLYGGVRSAIISVGRNPLSKKLILRSMVKVIIAGLIVFIIGLFAVYLLLKL